MNSALIFVYGIGMYFLGRYSTLVLKNKILEEKKAELIEDNERLIKFSEDLIEQDKRIRDKWKSMVTDFSKYQACITDPNELGKWTETDDIYLNSWHSADK